MESAQSDGEASYQERLERGEGEPREVEIWRRLRERFPNARISSRGIDLSDQMGRCCCDEPECPGW